MQYAYLTSLLNGMCETFARLSIIFLYHRIFAVQQWMMWSLRVVGALTVAWMVIIIFVVSLQCRPIKALLDPTVIAPRCLNNSLGLLVTEIVNACLDLVLLSLPISSVAKLRLDLRERLGMAGLFAMGGL